jgi:hypothetical protein
MDPSGPLGRGLLALMLFGGAAACSTQGGASETGGGESDFHWGNPIAGGTVITDAAAADVAFAPLVPQGLGDSILIQETPADSTDGPLRELAFVYDDPSIGQFVIFEHLAEGKATLAEWNDLAAVQPGCMTSSPADSAFGSSGPRIECHFGDRSVVTIRGGTTAFLFEGDQTVAVQWLEQLDSVSKEVAQVFQDPYLEIEIQGPAAELSGDEALKIAEEV